MDQIWLGYDNLSIQFEHISAVLFYRQSLDSQIIRSYGRVPYNIRAVILTDDGHCWPSSRQVEPLRRQWARWRSKDDKVTG